MEGRTNKRWFERPVHRVDGAGHWSRGILWFVFRIWGRLRQ